jgi:hypothetical protein
LQKRTSGLSFARLIGRLLCPDWGRRRDIGLLDWSMRGVTVAGALALGWLVGAEGISLAACPGLWGHSALPSSLGSSIFSFIFWLVARDTSVSWKDIRLGRQAHLHTPCPPLTPLSRLQAKHNSQDRQLSLLILSKSITTHSYSYRLSWPARQCAPAPPASPRLPSMSQPGNSSSSNKTTIRGQKERAMALGICLASCGGLPAWRAQRPL